MNYTDLLFETRDDGMAAAETKTTTAVSFWCGYGGDDYRVFVVQSFNAVARVLHIKVFGARQLDFRGQGDVRIVCALAL